MSVEGEGFQGERASPDCAVGEKHAFQGWVGSGVQRACDFLAAPQVPPCIVWWPRVTVFAHITSRVSRGLNGEEKAKAWGTNPRRNSLRRPTCVQGGKKPKTKTTTKKKQTNLTLHMGKHPHPTPHEEIVSPHGQKDFHISTHRRLVSQWRAKNAPQVFKGPGPEEIMGLSAWEKTRFPARNPMSTLTLLHKVLTNPQG